MDVYLVQTFSNGMVSFAMAESVWMMIREWGILNQSNTEHIAKVRAALTDDRRSAIRMLTKRFHIDKKNCS